SRDPGLHLGVGQGGSEVSPPRPVPQRPCDEGVDLQGAVIRRTGVPPLRFRPRHLLRHVHVSRSRSCSADVARAVSADHSRWLYEWSRSYRSRSTSASSPGTPAADRAALVAAFIRSSYRRPASSMALVIASNAARAFSTMPGSSSAG